MKTGSFLKTLGPGLLWAAAAVGVSHLVQSTRAGAGFGFELVWLIILANLLKYPFFEFGPRYAAATGENLVYGYNRSGKWAVVLYALITVSTMFSLLSAITAVTAGIFENVFRLGLSTFQWAVIILAGGALVVVFRKYSTIDRIVKVIIAILSVSAVVAVIAAASQGFNPDPDYSTHFSFGRDLVFVLALAGWMPSAIDISVWHSAWTTAKAEETGHKPKLKEALTDFNIGYLGTAVLSLIFLSLGALVMYGKPDVFSDKGAVFAGQLIDLFTKNLGSFAYYIIAPAALATMVSTSLTCLDAYPRVLGPTTKLLFRKKPKKSDSRNLHLFWLLFLVAGTAAVFAFFMNSMTEMVDFATVVSFITAPVLGFMNLKAVTGKNMPEGTKPKPWLISLSIIGLIVLSGFSLYYLYVVFV